MPDDARPLTQLTLLIGSADRTDSRRGLAAVGSDPAVTWQRQAITLDHSRAALANRIRHWGLHGFGIFAVLDKADGRLLGHAGLQHLEDTEDIVLGYYLARTTQRSLLRLVLAQRWHE